MAIEVTDSNWGNELTGKTCVVKLGAKWCNPCHAIGPAIKEVESLGLDVFTIDIDDHEILAGQFGVRSIPTVLFIKNGEVAETIVGAVSQHRYLEAADKLLH